MVDGVCWHVSSQQRLAVARARIRQRRISTLTRLTGRGEVVHIHAPLALARKEWSAREASGTEGIVKTCTLPSAVCERALLDPPRFHNHRAIRVKKHLPAHTSSSAPRFEILLLKVCVGKSAGGRMHCEYTELVLNIKSGENSSENTTRRTPYH